MFFSLFNGCYFHGRKFLQSKRFQHRHPKLTWYQPCQWWWKYWWTSMESDLQRVIENPWSLTARHLKNVGWTTTFLWGKEQLFRAYVKLHVFCCGVSAILSSSKWVGFPRHPIRLSSTLWRFWVAIRASCFSPASCFQSLATIKFHSRLKGGLKPATINQCWYHPPIWNKQNSSIKMVHHEL